MSPSDSDKSDLKAIGDEELMLLVANGVIEEPATELFRRHNRALFNFLAWQCGGNAGEAEDIAQKTWVKLMTRCADYRPGAAAFRSFLFQIARNTWLDARRSAYDATRVELDETQHELPPDDFDAEQLVSLRQQQHRVHAALLALPAQQREVVVLRFFNDMSIEDISGVVGEGFETVKSRLRYAFGKLRRELEGKA